MLEISLKILRSRSNSTLHVGKKINQSGSETPRMTSPRPTPIIEKVNFLRIFLKFSQKISENRLVVEPYDLRMMTSSGGSHDSRRDVEKKTSRGPHRHFTIEQTLFRDRGRRRSTTLFSVVFPNFIFLTKLCLEIFLLLALIKIAKII